MPLKPMPLISPAADFEPPLRLIRFLVDIGHILRVDDIAISRADFEMILPTLFSASTVGRLWRASIAFKVCRLKSMPYFVCCCRSRHFAYHLFYIGAARQ